MTLTVRYNNSEKALGMMVKLPFETTTSHTALPRSKVLFLIQLSANMHPTRQHGMAQVVGSLPATRESWTEFPAAGIGMAELQVLQSFGSEPADKSTLSLFPSPSLSFPLLK